MVANQVKPLPTSGTARRSEEGTEGYSCLSSFLPSNSDFQVKQIKFLKRVLAATQFANMYLEKDYYPKYTKNS